MNRNILLKRTISLLTSINKYPTISPLFMSHKYPFSTQQPQNPISHKFTYGQGGQLTFNLTNRTYSLSLQTIWQDHAQLEYSGLTGPNSFFLTEKGKQVNFDDIDLNSDQKQYIRIHAKIPEDYTIRGKINGSIHHLKNSVSSKTRSNPFEIQILGYKNTYQWLNIESQDVKITNKNGQVNISSITAKDALINCESFKSKKVLYSGSFTLKASKHAEVRSFVAYQDALTQILDSGDVEIQSLSGKVNVSNTKSLKIDRLLSCKDGINIVCKKVNTHIVVESGTGSIQCLKQPKEVLQEKIKLGKMHKGRLEFDVENELNPAYSRVLVCM